MAKTAAHTTFRARVAAPQWRQRKWWRRKRSQRKMCQRQMWSLCGISPVPVLLGDSCSGGPWHEPCARRFAAVVTAAYDAVRALVVLRQLRQLRDDGCARLLCGNCWLGKKAGQAEGIAKTPVDATLRARVALEQSRSLVRDGSTLLGVKLCERVLNA